MTMPKSCRSLSDAPVVDTAIPFPLPASTRSATPRRCCRLVTTAMAILLSSIVVLGAAATADTIVLEPPPGLASTREPWAPFVTEASRRFDVPEPWIRAVIAIESAGVVDAISPKGAMGLMQLMPETYAGLRERYGLGADAFDPRDNILAGTALLRELHDRFGAPGFLAAYNAGPGRYLDHLATGRPLPAETRAYVATLAPVITDVQLGRPVAAAGEALDWQAAPLFVGHRDDGPVDQTVAPMESPGPVPDGPQAIDRSAFAPQSDNLFAGRADAPGP
ncbi:MAG: lytic transglycosylase domain-containing protein [Alphaproteobacteria bacterium]